MYNDKGDFIINAGLIMRYKENQKIYFYTGAQIISLDVLKEYRQEKFSFNIWQVFSWPSYGYSQQSEFGYTIYFVFSNDCE